MDSLAMSDDDDEQHKSLYDVSVEVTAVLGFSTMKVSQLLKMGRGAVVLLDTSIGDDIEIRANGNTIARGEVVVVEDHMAVNMTKIYKSGFTH